MPDSSARCPACQTPYSPDTAICATCGRVLTSAALTTIPVAATVEQPPALPPLLSPPLQVGQALANGRYTIQRPLSQGGMGALYLATDREAFGRTVVIKGLLGMPIPPTLTMFKRRATALSAKLERSLRWPIQPFRRFLAISRTATGTIL